jgi:4-diphosphocytidyl-2-C-methyl-D-erythritol kinase
MIRFPNAKINLGLQIVEKRADGYHNIETVFYPVNWCDALELTENKGVQGSSENCRLHLSGLPIDGNPNDNLLLKAYTLLSGKKKLPAVDVRLHKEIPMGAGLGGGSADAAFLLKMLNEYFSIGLSEKELEKEAAVLGSDCAFFVTNEPVYAHGKGDQFEPVRCSLKGYEIVVVYPNIHSNTKLAYSRVVPKPGKVNLKKFIEEAPIRDWKEHLVNDFEPSVFHHYPETALIKDQLYHSGALYASLSGSGSAVFGIFDREEEKTVSFDPTYKVFRTRI